MAATVRGITLGRYSDSVDAKDDEVTLLDNKKIYLGTGNDLQIYHDGSNSFVQDTGTGELKLAGDVVRIVNADNTATQLKAQAGGAVELYHIDAKKLETTADGIEVTGKIVSSSHLDFADDVKLLLGTGDDLEIYHDGSDSYINETGTGDLIIDSSHIIFKDGGVEVLETTNSGIRLKDSKTLILGSGSDLELVHDGSDSYIADKGTGGLIISSGLLTFKNQAQDETYATMTVNGAVDLYYDNDQKFETTANGIKAAGSAATGIIGKFHAESASFTSVTLQSVASRNTTNETYNHFKCSINGVADKLIVRDSGDVDNSNNSYGSLSDVNLKENIVDAGSQWNDIKNIRVRKFNFKDTVDPNTPTLLGVIAQEAELVCPKLVKNSTSIQAGEEKDYKSFKYSVLYMKAIKALQEAMAKIETLETKVAALEAG